LYEVLTIAAVLWEVAAFKIWAGGSG